MSQTNLQNPHANSSLWLYVAWLTSLTATLCALFIGEVLGQTPCVLCWYQRIAMFPLAWILGVACLTNDRQVARYALPLTLIGLAFALWHSLLYAGIIEEALAPCERDGPSCTDTAMLTFSGLPIPYLSLASFTAVVVFLTIFHLKSRHLDTHS